MDNHANQQHQRKTNDIYLALYIDIDRYCRRLFYFILFAFMRGA